MTRPAVLPTAVTGEGEILLEDGSRLLPGATVRELPGRRRVCRALWQGRPVYAKLFHGRKSGRDAGRDARGARALAQAAIPAPALLYDGATADGSGRVLVYAAIEEGCNAEDAWRALVRDADARLALAERLVATVAAHHNAGLVQRDMYLKNFLVTEAAVFTLDGDAIRPLPVLFGRAAALANLALLLSKFDADDDVWLPRLHAAYVRGRGWQVREADVRRLRARTAALRRRVASRYADAKVFRPCSDVVVTRDFHRYRAIARRHDTPALQALLDDLDRRLAGDGARPLKRGNTCTVAAMQLDGREVVVKRYNIKNFWHGLSRAWRSSRAAVSWANAHRLGVYGIATPAPLALQERRWGPLRREAYFVADRVEAPDALAFFADPAIPRGRKAEAAMRIARLMDKLARLGVVHGDMKATNLKMLPDGTPVLLDLDALHEPRLRGRLRRGLVRDLRRLLQNWRDVPETALLLRDALWQVYTDAGLLRRAGILGEET